MSGIDDLISGIDSTIQKAIDNAAEEAAKYAAARTKGELADSIGVRKIGQHGREIFSGKPYADFVENGRPGFKARGKALRFVVNGSVIFRKSVGPAAPKPFMAPARSFLEREVARQVEQALGRLA